MKKKRHTEAQIAFALRQAVSGTPVYQIVRKMEISEATHSVAGHNFTRASPNAPGSSGRKNQPDVFDAMALNYSPLLMSLLGFRVLGPDRRKRAAVV